VVDSADRVSASAAASVAQVLVSAEALVVDSAGQELASASAADSVVLVSAD
jgi:hypothetical protein